MATKGKKPRARLDSDTERKLIIDVWANILGESSGIMMMTVVWLGPNTPMRYICTSLIAVYALGVIEDKIFSGNKLVRVSIAIPIQN